MARSFTVPLSITGSWIVTGDFNISYSDAGTPFQLELPLAFNGRTREGWVNPLILNLYLPNGVKLPPRVVYPQSIPLNEAFQYFLFRPFTARGSGDVNLRVSTVQNANLLSALLIGDQQSAIIKRTGRTIPLSIEWEWTVSGVVKANDLKVGFEYEISLSLTLNGNRNEGWDAPLFLLIKLPWLEDDEQPSPKEVDPKSIPLNGTYNDFSFPAFVAKKVPGDLTIQFMVSTIQKAKLPSSLLIGGQIATVKEVA